MNVSLFCPAYGLGRLLGLCKPARSHRRWQHSTGALVLAAALAWLGAPALADAAALQWIRVGALEVARTETTVGQFRAFAQAKRWVTLAERNGGGEVYESGWTRKPGWSWQTPFGQPASDQEPAVHVTYDEAQAFCHWAGARLPTDTEWVRAAYLEQRASPPAGWVHGKRYPYPTGDQPTGAQCLDDCGPEARGRALRGGAALWRGYGHARAGSTPAGVNGLHDMGGNVWEWVDEPPGASGAAERRTRGGSWWYGQAQMLENYLQSKPGNTAVVYIGFRCVRDVR